MASLSKSGKTHIIHIRTPDGRRYPIRLGAITRRRAETVRDYVATLERAASDGFDPPAGVLQWIAGIGDELKRKLAKAGLIQIRDVGAATVGAFTRQYIDGRHDLKPTTKAVLQRARRYLIEHFGADRRLDSITRSDAQDWRQAMLKRGYRDATVRRSAGISRQFWKAATDAGLVTENPWASVPATIRATPDRLVFVRAETIERIIAAVPCPQWRLLIALARYGGLRVPSEALALKWADVNFAEKRFIVRSSKTEHHRGGGIRVVPMFPELEARLVDAFARADEGDEHCITRYRSGAQNVGTQFRRFIELAGVKPWPRLWQNLRSSRATELANAYPGHVAAAWLGHCEAIADRHYRQVTDEHYAQAVSDAEGPSGEAVRQAVRAMHASERTKPISLSACALQAHEIALETLSDGPYKT